VAATGASGTASVSAAANTCRGSYTSETPIELAADLVVMRASRHCSLETGKPDWIPNAIALADVELLELELLLDRVSILFYPLAVACREGK
jgi:hypothetical protein